MVLIRKTQNRPKGSYRQAYAGFTLIELLVAISIIVLLIAILLPVVTKAERMADQAVCGSNQRQIAVAVTVYATDHREYLPGPNTSGLALLQTPMPPDSAATANPTNPVSPDDWVSPVFGAQWGLSGGDRGAKIKAIMNREELRCPANEFRYDGGVGPRYTSMNAAGTIQYASYSMPYTMHAYASAAETPASGGFHLSSQDRTAVDLALAGHGFRLDTLGTLSLKVMLADGANEVRYSTSLLVYNTAYGSQGDGGLPNGGNFMSRGATLHAGSSSTLQHNPYRYNQDPNSLHPLAEQITYRHNKTINAAFWDGHVENMDTERSRDAELWFPSGSRIRSSFRIADPDARAGATLP